MSTWPNHAIKTTSTTAGGIRETARCPVRELAIRELAYPRVVQLPADLHPHSR